MKILIATGHPAQVHNFRIIREELIKRGHQVYWVASKKDISEYLLNAYGIEYTQLKRPKKGIISKMFTLFQNALITAKVIHTNKIDFVVSRVNPGVVLGAFVMGRTQVGMSDTEAAGIYDLIFTKFIGAFITSTSFERTIRKDQIRIASNIELFYLHRNYFNYDKEAVYKLLDIPFNTPYVIVRFVSGTAFHDAGHNTFSEQNKLELLKAITPYAKVFISSEVEMVTELKPYQIKIPFEQMHKVLAEATLFFGEGASMASESAMLGTPAVYVNDLWAGSTNDEQRAGLLFSFKTDEQSQKESIKKAVNLLTTPQIKEITQNKLTHFVGTMIDPVAFFSWFIESYPESKRIMIENPDYQYRFK